MALRSPYNGVVRTLSVVQSGLIQCIMEGTNIKLFGNASHTSYTINLDGTSRSDISSSPDTNVLASFTDLTDGDHILSLIHNSPSPLSNTSYISFDRAVMNLPRPTLVQGYVSCTFNLLFSLTPNPVPARSHPSNQLTKRISLFTEIGHFNCKERARTPEDFVKVRQGGT